jgi:macrodomain Ter protein organizer (MatP/YcbG family)
MKCKDCNKNLEHCTCTLDTLNNFSEPNIIDKWLEKHGDPEIARQVEIAIVKSNLELLNNFYFGKDLRDKNVRLFYKGVLKLAKKDLKKRLKQLLNGG